MQIISSSIDDIIPYEQNAKKHPADQVQLIANSIKKFGFKIPCVIDKDNNLIAGHGRLLAAKKLKLKEVPCVIADDLTDDEIKAFRLADNKVAESDWDLDILNSELNSIELDMTLFGFEPEEEKQEVVEVPVPDEIKVQANPGDVWILGRHRLKVGDSTDPEQVKELMNGEVADLVITDPPYNMKYEGTASTKDRKSKRMMNDNMSEEKFKEFLTAALRNNFDNLHEGASAYVFYKELGNGTFLTSAKDAGFIYKQELVWVKNHLVLGGSKYQSIYEPFLMVCKKNIKTWNGKRKQVSVIEDVDFMDEKELRDRIKELVSESGETDIIRVDKNMANKLHPTMKPVKLFAYLATNSSNPHDIVLDTFGGSGSTLMACEQIDRTCYTMELDPKFASVIIQRYIDFKGSDADVFCLSGGTA